jgi:hypothetical protein
MLFSNFMAKAMRMTSPRNIYDSPVVQPKCFELCSDLFETMDSFSDFSWICFFVCFYLFSS